MAFDDLPYRTPGVNPLAPMGVTPVSQDEVNYNTLKATYIAMKAAIDDLDRWHAFDLDEKATGLLIKQQIRAHQKAYDILAPALQALESAVEKVDSDFIARQRS